jgi:hypothetical protein
MRADTPHFAAGTKTRKALLRCAFARRPAAPAAEIVRRKTTHGRAFNTAPEPGAGGDWPSPFKFSPRRSGRTGFLVLAAETEADNAPARRRRK